MGIVTPIESVTEKKTYVIKRIEPKKQPLYSFLKRFFDFVLSSLAVAVLLIPMHIVGLVIKIDSPGPAIFRQERLGKNGKPFILYKFRTMTIDAEKDGPQWAEENDSRCTKVGNFLRKTRIDELPQLVNVIKGDMSLVGPRPERRHFYEEFEEYINGFHHRLVVKPGITGLAQITGGYNLLPEEKIIYDMQYIEKMSFKLDAYCILMTLVVVFTHEGAR
ncbi:MAG: exopolysaccharide biosynthesis polyprenyl glycosylphosphotransferase [Bacillota bacterium]|nr:exopolysaccharide biosynthesis polyprenyl glycosylphosphotransferase [Bacillota bacterium]NLL26964.1 exopolysaccharide biosynthesis polyprenyl glycosylphosphotransferase [Erysipelotrichia bacterium]